MTKSRNKESLRLQATKTGINFSIDLPRLMLEVLDDQTLNTIVEGGRTLREVLEEIVGDPIREVLGNKSYPLR